MDVNALLEHLKKLIMDWVTFLWAQWPLTISIILLLVLLGVLWLRRRKRDARQLVLILAILVDLVAVICSAIVWLGGFSRSDTISIISAIATIIGAIATILGAIFALLALRPSSSPPPPPPPQQGEGLVHHIRGDRKGSSLALELKDGLVKRSYSFLPRESRPRSLARLIEELKIDLKKATPVILVLSARYLEKLDWDSRAGKDFIQIVSDDDCRVILVIAGVCKKRIMNQLAPLNPIWVVRQAEDVVFLQLIDRIECARKKRAARVRHGQYP